MNVHGPGEVPVCPCGHVVHDDEGCVVCGCARLVPLPPSLARRAERYRRRAERVELARFREIVDYEGEHTIGDPLEETAAMIAEWNARLAALSDGECGYDVVAEAERLLAGDL